MIGLYLTYLPDTEPPVPEELLSLYRREKLSRQTNGLVRRQSLLSELLLRHALRESGLVLPAALELRTGEYGKPYLADGSFFFSLSHSGNAVLCAVGERELGADIQLRTPFNEAMLHRFFAPEERDFVLAASDRDEAYTEIWTEKESYIKAAGRGFTLPLASFSVLDRAIAARLRHGTAGDCHVSVCSDADALPERIDCIRVENSALLG